MTRKYKKKENFRSPTPNSPPYRDNLSHRKFIFDRYDSLISVLACKKAEKELYDSQTLIIKKSSAFSRGHLNSQAIDSAQWLLGKTFRGATDRDECCRHDLDAAS